MATTGLCYADYKFSAVIDWVEVRVTLDQPTQPRHVRARIQAALPHWGTTPFINAVTEDVGCTAKVITFRVQTPTGPAVFLRELQHVAPVGHRPLTSTDMEIIGIEVALDLFHADQDPQALVAACLHMFRHRSRIPAARPRITEFKHYRIAAHVGDISRALADGWSINTPKSAGLSYAARYYVKMFDSINGAAYTRLPLHQHRARMESILVGGDLPFTTIEGWREFKFQKLAPFFALRLATPSAPLAALMQDQLAQLGTPYNQAKVSGHRRQTRRGTMADSAWGERMRVALRGLTGANRSAGIRTVLRGHSTSAS